MTDDWPCEECGTLRHELEEARTETARLRQRRNELYDASDLGRIADDLDEDNDASEAKTVRAAIETIDKMRRALLETVRALLAVEWAGGNTISWCPRCEGVESAMGDWKAGHEAGCSLDAALIAAGLPDQFSRDKARAEIAKKRA